METIIILNGAPGAGKDTFCDICLTEALCAIGQSSMIDAAKRVTNLINDNLGPYNEINKKDDRKREFLYKLKKALDIYDISLYEVANDYNAFTYNTDVNGEFDKLFIIHAREYSDILRLTRFFGINHNLKIIRVFINKNEVEKDYGNPADDNIYNCGNDYIIENNRTLEEYRESIRTFLNEIGVKTI